MTIASSVGPARPAIFPAIAASVAGDGAQPEISASAAQARSRDRNCPCHKYAPSATARGPHCTGAVTPSGARPCSLKIFNCGGLHLVTASAGRAMPEA